MISAKLKILKKSFEGKENSPYMRKILLCSMILGLFMGGAVFYLYKEKESLTQLKESIRTNPSMVFLYKGSNIDSVRSWLIDLSKITMKGLWLTKISFKDAENTVELSLRAIEQTDIYKYSTILEGVFRDKKLCLLSSDVAKKNEKKLQTESQDNEKPVPFVLAYLAKQKAQQTQQEEEVTKNATPVKRNNDSVRWAYGYEATFKFGKCF